MQERTESKLLSRYTARDGLTGAFTRPYFLSLLIDECRFAVEMGKPFCVCLVDIDQLRKVNEERGLGAGDALLADTAEAIRLTLDLPQWGNLRCLMGRYDGDSLIQLGASGKGFHASVGAAVHAPCRLPWPHSAVTTR